MSQQLLIEQRILKSKGFDVSNCKTLFNLYRRWFDGFGFQNQDIIDSFLADDDHINFFIFAHNNPFIQSEIYQVKQAVKQYNIVHDKRTLFEALDFIKDFLQNRKEI